MPAEGKLTWTVGEPSDLPSLLRHSVNARTCATCMFGGKYPGDTPELRERVEKILADGVNLLCHTTETTTCRGARDFQLAVYYQRGWIEEPTDEALRRMYEDRRRQAES